MKKTLLHSVALAATIVSFADKAEASASYINTMRRLALGEILDVSPSGVVDVNGGVAFDSTDVDRWLGNASGAVTSADLTALGDRLKAAGDPSVAYSAGTVPAAGKTVRELLDTQVARLGGAAGSSLAVALDTQVARLGGAAGTSLVAALDDVAVNVVGGAPGSNLKTDLTGLIELLEHTAGVSLATAIDHNTDVISPAAAAIVGSQNGVTYTDTLRRLTLASHILGGATIEESITDLFAAVDGSILISGGRISTSGNVADPAEVLTTHITAVGNKISAGAGSLDAKITAVSTSLGASAASAAAKIADINLQLGNAFGGGADVDAVMTAVRTQLHAKLADYIAGGATAGPIPQARATAAHGILDDGAGALLAPGAGHAITDALNALFP